MALSNFRAGTPVMRQPIVPQGPTGLQRQPAGSSPLEAALMGRTGQPVQNPAQNYATPGWWGQQGQQQQPAASSRPVPPGMTPEAWTSWLASRPAPATNSFDPALMSPQWQRQIKNMPMPQQANPAERQGFMRDVAENRNWGMPGSNLNTGLFRPNHAVATGHKNAAGELQYANAPSWRNPIKYGFNPSGYGGG